MAWGCANGAPNAAPAEGMQHEDIVLAAFPQAKLMRAYEVPRGLEWREPHRLRTAAGLAKLPGTLHIC